MSQIEVPIRIATWSGPRNISTAMMRAWDNRRDTFVIDEPFYAYYLKATRKQHPGADEVIATGETDWRKVVAQLTGPIPNGKRIFFQKQMTHHLLPDIDRQWLRSVSTLPSRCFRGRQASARPMVFGQSIGMAKWQDRHRFGRIVPEMMRYRSSSVKFTNAAASVTKDCTNIDCVEMRMLDHPVKR